MKKKVLTFGMVLALFACASTQKTSTNQKPVLLNKSTFLITEIATDKTYGLSPKNPVQVGGAKNSKGPLNERRFLNALAGPNGEKISYYRSGSCCPIKSSNNPYGFDSVMLDNYRVTWENSKDTISIYINMYDSGKLKAPTGFTIKK